MNQNLTEFINIFHFSRS